MKIKTSKASLIACTCVFIIPLSFSKPAEAMGSALLHEAVPLIMRSLTRTVPIMPQPSILTAKRNFGNHYDHKSREEMIEEQSRWHREQAEIDEKKRKKKEEANSLDDSLDDALLLTIVENKLSRDSSIRKSWADHCSSHSRNSSSNDSGSSGGSSSYSSWDSGRSGGGSGGSGGDSGGDD